MRKTLLVITILFLIVLLSGCAGSKKEFELRNGIQFGDSIEDVKQKETLKLNEPYTDENDSSHEIVASELTTIAGIEDANVQYDFKDGKLYQMTYVFGVKTSELREVVLNRLTENYKSIDKTLTEKYGEPISSESGLNPGFHSNYYNQGGGVAAFKAFGLDADLIAEDERLFECRDGSHVVIDVSVGYYATDEYTFPQHFVSYYYVTKEEWDKGASEIEQHQDSIDSEF